MNYLAHFNQLSRDLRQNLEAGDKDSNFQFINSDQGMVITNQTIKELIELNPARWTEEETYYFNGTTTIFNLPDIYQRLLAYYDEDAAQWKVPLDASDLTGDVRAISDRKLSFVTPKEKGDGILLRVVKYPPDITNDSDAVPFPEQFLTLLRLQIVFKEYGRKGKEPSESTKMIYGQEYEKFVNSSRTIKNGSRLRRRGYGFGN